MINQEQPFTSLQQKRLDALIEEYRIDPEEDLVAMIARLMRRVDIIPIELVLMQAANESAWGTSRFAQKGYNFFGLWCFKKVVVLCLNVVTTTPLTKWQNSGV